MLNTGWRKVSDSEYTASPSIIGFSYVNTMYKNSNNNEKQNKNLPTAQEMENWKQARNRMNGSKKHLCVFVGLEASTKDTVKCIMLSEAVQANFTAQGTEKLCSFKSGGLLTQVNYSEKCNLADSNRNEKVSWYLCIHWTVGSNPIPLNLESIALSTWPCVFRWKIE